MECVFGPRRAVCVDVGPAATAAEAPLSAAELAPFETLDLVYRSLCALLYNYVPMSGHPGGSISSGRFVAGALFDALDYDLGDPDRDDADIISYAAGHKAMGLYAMWALRDEIARLGARAAAGRRAPSPAPRGPARLPPQPDHRHAALHGACTPRPSTATPRRPRRSCGSRPAPPASASRARSAWPSARATATARTARASTSSRARAGSRRAAWPRRWPRPAPPRSATSSSTSTGTRPRSTATASAATATTPGDYVQWDPGELFYLHDWNVVHVPDGHDFQQVVAAQRRRAGDRQRPAHRDRLPHAARAGSTASRAGPRTAPATSSAPRASTRPSAELTGGGEAALPTCEAGEQRCAGPAAATRCARSASGRRSRSCARRLEQRHGRCRGAGRAARGGPRAARPARPHGRARARRASRPSTSSPRAPRRRPVPTSCASSPAPRRRCATRSAAPCTTSTRPRAAPSSRRRPTCSARPA